MLDSAPPPRSSCGNSPLPGWFPARQCGSSQSWPLLCPTPSPACIKRCLPPPGQAPECPGLERVKNCSEAGDADFSPPAFAAIAIAPLLLAAACCSPLPNICPSRLEEMERAAASGLPGVLSSTQGRSAPPVRRTFAIWVRCAHTRHLQIGDTETREAPIFPPSYPRTGLFQCGAF